MEIVLFMKGDDVQVNKKNLLMLMLLFIIFGVLYIPHKAYADTRFEEDGFVYRINEDGTTVSLIKDNRRFQRLAELIIPGEVNAGGRTYKVIKIAGAALSGVNSDKVIFSEGILEIEANQYLKAREVYFPSSLQKVGTLSNIDEELLGNVEKIEVAEGNNYFCVLNNALCSKDKKELIWVPKADGVYKVPDGILTIQPFAFADCKLSGVIMPDSLTTIKSRAFNQCLSLRKVTFGKGTRKVAGDAFSYTKSLKKIIIPSSNKYLCLKKGAIYTKNGKTLINAGTRKGTLVLSKHVTKLQEGAVAYNNRIKKVVIQGKVRQIPDFCFKNSLLRDIDMPNGIISIGKSSFENCYDMAVLILPKKLREIKDRAFYNCGFYQLIIPERVNKIGKDSLKSSIEELVFLGKKVPSIQNQEICGYGMCSNPEDGEVYNPLKAEVIPGITEIRVPKKAYKQYKKAFKNKLTYRKMVKD